MGERSNFTAMPQAIAAMRQILHWGVENIGRTLAAANRGLAERCRELDIVTVPEGLRAGHFLGLRFRGGIPAELGDRLAERKIFVSVRGTSMRVTPHLYNSTQDIDRFLEVLAHEVRR